MTANEQQISPTPSSAKENVQKAVAPGPSPPNSFASANPSAQMANSNPISTHMMHQLFLAAANHAHLLQNANLLQQQQQQQNGGGPSAPTFPPAPSSNAVSNVPGIPPPIQTPSIPPHSNGEGGGPRPPILDHFHAAALVAAAGGAPPNLGMFAPQPPPHHMPPLGIYPAQHNPNMFGPINGGFYGPHPSFHPYVIADPPGKKKNATRENTAPLKSWLNEHRKNPYPTKPEKMLLALVTNMTMTQVSTWFANARRRLKKENKMTWSPRHRNEDDDDFDDDDNVGAGNGAANGSIERASSSASISSNNDNVVDNNNGLIQPAGNSTESKVQNDVQPQNRQPKIWSIEDTLQVGDHQKQKPPHTHQATPSSCSSADEQKDGKLIELSHSSSSSLSPNRLIPSSANENNNGGLSRLTLPPPPFVIGPSGSVDFAASLAAAQHPPFLNNLQQFSNGGGGKYTHILPGNVGSQAAFLQQLMLAAGPQPQQNPELQGLIKPPQLAGVPNFLMFLQFQQQQRQQQAMHAAIASQFQQHIQQQQGQGILQLPTTMGPMKVAQTPNGVENSKPKLELSDGNNGRSPCKPPSASGPNLSSNNRTSTISRNQKSASNKSA